jgi:starch phosphorylase
VLPHFNSNRLLHDYACCFYGPAARQAKDIIAGDYAGARELAEWKSRVRAAWSGVSLRLTEPAQARVEFDTHVPLEVSVQLNGLSPQDVRVECVVHREVCSELTVPVKQYAQYRGAQDGVRHIGPNTVFVAPFQAAGTPAANGECRYRLELNAPWCGGLRYEIRALPQHRCLTHPYETGLMRWL